MSKEVATKAGLLLWGLSHFQFFDPWSRSGRAPCSSLFLMASTAKRGASLFTLSCLWLGVSVGRMPLIWDVCRLSEQEAEFVGGTRTPWRPQDKQERHLWVEDIVSHPKEITPPINKELCAQTSTFLSFVERQNPLSWLSCFNLS